MFLVFFGVASVLTQIESAYFLTSLPAGALSYIVALGALVAAPCFSFYFGFGYWIAWQSPALRDFYGGVDEGGFIANMASALRQDPGRIPFQLFRTGLWLGIGVIVIWTLQRRRLETRSCWASSSQC